MKALLWALTILATVLAGAARSQTRGPPGGVIEHIGPLNLHNGSFVTGPLDAPALTTAQKAAIVRAVTRDKSKSTVSEDPEVTVGEPAPTAELHPLPADALEQAPAARPYRYTVLADKVVLVDPVTFRVIDVIKP